MMSVDESLMCSFQILKPSEKKAKYQYSGVNSARPVTPPPHHTGPEEEVSSLSIHQRKHSSTNTSHSLQDPRKQHPSLEGGYVSLSLPFSSPYSFLNMLVHKFCCDQLRISFFLSAC
ncbi:hypothetical protein SRHO_G00129080 [Serrasalmus rhombeus]